MTKKRKDVWKRKGCHQLARDSLRAPSKSQRHHGTAESCFPQASEDRPMALRASLAELQISTQKSVSPVGDAEKQLTSRFGLLGSSDVEGFGATGSTPVVVLPFVVPLIEL